jgi:uncharacterized protein
MIALLDVNMLVALMDSRHLHHGKARGWWAAEKASDPVVRWASCAITETGFLRIVTLGAYPNRFQLADALSVLRRAIALPGHVFWPEDVSLLDEAVIDHSRLLGPRQITDIYLLALAVRHDGRLVTLDTGITTAAVRGAKTRHLLPV